MTSCAYQTERTPSLPLTYVNIIGRMAEDSPTYMWLWPEKIRKPMRQEVATVSFRVLAIDRSPEDTGPRVV